MKTNNLLWKTLQLLFVVFFATSVAAQKHPRVLFYGQDFMVGNAMFMPAKNSFPAQLSAMLGDKTIVRINGQQPLQAHAAPSIERLLE